MGVEEAFASTGAFSKPNIATENWQGVAGRPPISKRPSPSVTVVILSAPQSAFTVAPGMGWPPERTTPVCTSAAAKAAKTKTRHVKRSMHESFDYSHNTRSWRVVPYSDINYYFELIKPAFEFRLLPSFTFGRDPDLDPDKPAYIAFLAVKVCGPRPWS